MSNQKKEKLAIPENKGKFSNSKLYNELYSAFFCSCIKVVIVQPFDMLRFRMQSLTIPKNQSFSVKYLLSGIQSKEGLRVFYKASTITSKIVFFNTGFQLTFFQRIVHFLGKDIKEKYAHEKTENFEKWNRRLTILNAKSGLMSGLICGTLFNPLDNIRIRILSSQNVVCTKTKMYRNNKFIPTLLEIISKEGYKGLFTALPLTLVREGFASAMYFSFFEYNMNKVRRLELSDNKKISMSFCIGACAGLLNWTLTLPVDVVRTKVISDKVVAHTKMQYTNMFDCAYQLYQTKGITGFYVGYKVMVVRSMVVNGMVLSLFDYLRIKKIV